MKCDQRDTTFDPAGISSDGRIRPSLQAPPRPDPIFDRRKLRQFLTVDAATPAASAKPLENLAGRERASVAISALPQSRRRQRLPRPMLASATIGVPFSPSRRSRRRTEVHSSGPIRAVRFAPVPIGKLPQEFS
jgi:hypothetical protein